MKALESIRYKFLNLLRSTSEGFSPVVGSLLLLFITFVLAGVIFSSLNLSGSGTNLQSPVANIKLESCEGGLYGVGPTADRARCEENRIILMHEGGDSLSLDSISIKIFGYGNSYKSVFGGNGTLMGNLSVFYLDLSKEGKNFTCYVANNNATLEDGSWDVGERLVLCGQDSPKEAVKSSLIVSVDGNGNTSDSYGFKAGNEITLKVIDNKGRNVIAERKATVKLAD